MQPRCYTPKPFLAILLLLIGMGFAAPFAHAEDNNICLPAFRRTWPQLAEVGKGHFSTLLFDIYDISLYAPHGQWRADQPQALAIRYLLAINGAAIVDRTVEEIQRQGVDSEKLADWREKIRRLFPDVQKNTVLGALYQPGKETVFYKDGAVIGRVADPDFGRAFFAIWLGKNTSEPALRAQLIGTP